MSTSPMIRLRPRLLHLSFLTKNHIRTPSPKYLPTTAIPSSSSQWPFFSSANTTFHQIKTLSPGGNRFPVCSVLTHIFTITTYSAMIIDLYFSYSHHILRIMCLLIRLSMPSSAKIQKLNFCIVGASFNFLLVIYQINTLFSPTHSLTHSFATFSSISGSNISKHDHPTLHR